MRRLLTGLGAALLLAGGVLAGGMLVGAAPAAATALPLSQCTTSSGVILAVDFGHWGGPIVRGCGSTPTTGFQLLNQGGWQSTGTQRDGAGLICRIGYSGYQGGTAYPTPAADPCVRTPPTTAYWSYWHANPGDSGWSYSQDGAASYSPKPGSVDLWTFGGSGGSPGVSPDALRAHNSPPGGGSSAPAPHSSAPSGGGPSGGSAGGGSTVGSAGSGTGPAGSPTAGSPAVGSHGSVAGAKPGAKTVRAVPRSSAAGGSASAAEDSASRIVNADPAPAAHRSTGSALPGLVTAALVLLLGSSAAVVSLRRRRAG
jgi:hypothetical protein